MLRWRLKRRGFRGLQVKTVEAGTGDQDQQSDVEEEFFRAGRKQAEERVERSVVRDWSSDVCSSDQSIIPPKYDSLDRIFLSFYQFK